jgi:hypothetical protein
VPTRLLRYDEEQRLLFPARDERGWRSCPSGLGRQRLEVVAQDAHAGSATALTAQVTHRAAEFFLPQASWLNTLDTVAPDTTGTTSMSTRSAQRAVQANKSVGSDAVIS